jgi:hypothetical protein
MQWWAGKAASVDAHGEVLGTDLQLAAQLMSVHMVPAQEPCCSVGRDKCVPVATRMEGGGLCC